MPSAPVTQWTSLTGNAGGRAWRSYQRDPLREILRLQGEYADGVDIRRWKRQMTFVFRPDDVRDVLVRGADVLSGRDFNLKFQGLQWESLLNMTGETHRDQRRLLMPAFRRDSYDRYEQDMDILIAAELRVWQDDSVRDLSADIHSLTIRLIGKTLFGVEFSRQDSEWISTRFDKIFAYTSYQSYWRQWPTRLGYPMARGDFRDALADIQQFAADLLGTAHSSTEEGGATLGETLCRYVVEGVMSRRMARDHVIGFLSAGHKTSAHALTWIVFLLARHPAALATIASELDETGAQTFTELRRVTAMDTVIREGLRLYPPAWAEGRRATADFPVSGGLLRRGDFVMVCQWATQRDPAIWGTDSNDFCPTRFESNGSGSLACQENPFAYFPFGAGPHKCIGERFAWLEMTLILKHLCRSFVLLPIGMAEVSQDPLIPPRLTNGLHLRVKRRSVVA